LNTNDTNFKTEVESRIFTVMTSFSVVFCLFLFLFCHRELNWRKIRSHMMSWQPIEM